VDPVGVVLAEAVLAEVDPAVEREAADPAEVVTAVALAVGVAELVAVEPVAVAADAD
jgi:hypothetical protein